MEARSEVRCGERCSEVRSGQSSAIQFRLAGAKAAGEKTSRLESNKTETFFGFVLS